MLLETSGINLKFVLENVCDKPKLQSTKTAVISTYGGQPDGGQNEQQQLQPANHIFYNAATKRYLTTFSPSAGRGGHSLGFSHPDYINKTPPFYPKPHFQIKTEETAIRAIVLN